MKKQVISRRQFIKYASSGLGAVVTSRLAPGIVQGIAKSAHVNNTLQVKREGILKVAWDATKNLDPAFVQTDSEIAFVNAIYDYLIDPTPSGGLSPRLAQKWDISADGLQYTFHIVPNVKFHDGTALTAADVKFTFDRLRDKTIGSPAASLYTSVTDIKVVDDVTITFTLAKTQPDFLFNIADSHAVILPKSVKDPKTTFIGSGPFKLDKFLPEDRATFVANEDYWIPDQPKLAGLQHLYMASDAQIAALSGGSVDVVLRMANSQFISLKDDPNLQTVNYPTSGHDLLRVRVDQAPGNNPKFIQAIKAATDREAIDQTVQLGLGATGRDTPIGPFFKDYFDPNSPLPAYNPDAAKQLLIDAGLTNINIDLHVPNTGGRPDFATVIKDQWAKIGITVNIKVEDETTYYSDNGWLEVPFGITGWAARPTPQQYLDFSLRSGGKWNESHLADPELDTQIDLAGTSLDQPTRIKAYKEIQRILSDHGPLIVPYFFPIVGAASKKVTFGDGFQPFTGRTDFRNVTLAAK